MFLDYRIRNYNFKIVIYMLVLSTLGVLVIQSATNSDTSIVSKQIIGLVLSLSICLFLSIIDYHQYFRFVSLIYGGCLLLLALVLLIGKSTNGATRWLPIGGFQIQPSEFTKIGVILMLSWYFSKYKDEINKAGVLGRGAIICLLPLAFIYLQPNLSTTIVILFTMVCIIYCAGISYKWIAGTIAVGIPVTALSLYLALQDVLPFLKKYQAQRILAKFFKGDVQYVDLNRQQNNSIMAIGSGQLHGKGLFTTTLTSVKNGNFLSEEQTDFIFAVIGEELGFIGSVALIVLYILLVAECLRIAATAKDNEGRLICTGMAALVTFQSFANIAVATGIFPNTGLPLPFISQGLSSLMSMFIGMGIVLNVGLQRNNPKA